MPSVVKVPESIWNSCLRVSSPCGSLWVPATLAGTIQKCAKSAKRGDLSNFIVFLRVDGTGVVDQALVNPATTLSTCVKGKMPGWKVSAPPAAGDRVKVGVNLKGKS